MARSVFGWVHCFRVWVPCLGLASVNCTLLVGAEAREQGATSAGERTAPAEDGGAAPSRDTALSRDSGQGSAGFSSRDGGQGGVTELPVAFDASAHCAGAALCDGVCVDLESDAEHCGNCQLACAEQQACEAGVCVAACSFGLSNCNGSCVDVRLNPAHCGQCANACEAGEVCSLGQCAAQCDEPLLACDGRCRDVETDREHCGACESPCPALSEEGAQRCVAGRCEPAPEDCENGQDDDANALSDCADPSCAAAYRCVEPSVPGWTEPFVLLLEPSGDPMACPTAFSNVVVSGVHQGLLAADPSCACDCVTSAKCSVSIGFYEDLSCFSEPWELSGENALESAECQEVSFEITGSDGAHSVWPSARLETAAAELTSCVSTSPPLLAPRWEFDAIGCAPQRFNGAGCGAGSCAPRDDAAPYCIAQQGEQNCPQAFPEKTLFYTDFSDDRSCSDCVCELGCGGEFWGYSDDDCSAGEQQLSLSNNCSALNADPTPLDDGAVLWETRSFRVPEPSCVAQADATGAASASGPVTVCCERL